MGLPRSLRGLGSRFALGMAGLLLLVGTPFFYLFYTLHRDRSIDSLTQATTDMSRLLVEAIDQTTFERSPHTLTSAVAQLAASQFVQRVLIVDKTGRVALSTDPRAVGLRVSRESPTCRACHARAPVRRSPTTIVSDDRGVEVFRTMRPVYNRPACHRCHAPGDRLNGVLMVDYSTTAARAQFRADVWRMIGLAVVMLPLTLLVIAALMNRLVVRRVRDLVRTTERVRAQDLTARATPGGDDEITVLGESFNAMAAALAQSFHEIERQRSYLEHLIDSIEEQVCVVDRSFRVVAANRSFVAAAGLWKGAIIGQPCATVSHGGGGGPCQACPARAVFATGLVQKQHFVVPGADHRERRYEIFCSPLRDEFGAVSQAIEVRRDVTERALLEANLHHSERLASLGLLASGISHEINNPLASVAACAAGLRRQIGDGSVDTPGGRQTMLEYLDLITRETMRAKTITERLLVLARPSSGAPSVIDLNQAILDTAALLRFQADCAAVELSTELEDGLPPIVADDTQVRQLVLNLVLNALQAAAAAPRAPGRVSIRTRAVDGRLELTVVDNGPSIAPGETTRIFEPFYSRRPGGQGTGLGLFIAQAIVRGLQGSIRVSSWPGEGAVFTVEVPTHDGNTGHPDRR